MDDAHARCTFDGREIKIYKDVVGWTYPVDVNARSSCDLRRFPVLRYEAQLLRLGVHLHATQLFFFIFLPHFDSHESLPLVSLRRASTCVPPIHLFATRPHRHAIVHRSSVRVRFGPSPPPGPHGEKKLPEEGGRGREETPWCPGGTLFRRWTCALGGVRRSVGDRRGARR